MVEKVCAGALSALLFFGAYIVGSIPTGWLLARFLGVKDIRQHGSGSTGATNVARVLGTPYFFVVFFLDALKVFSYLALLLSFWAPCDCLLIYALVLLIGNARPLFLEGTGGKGVATSFGIFLALCPSLLLWVVPIWLYVLFVTRTVGIASVVALCSAPLVALFSGVSSRFFLFLTAVAVWSIYLHRNNIRAYVHGKMR